MTFGIENLKNIVINVSHSDIALEPYDGVDIIVTTPKEKAFDFKCGNGTFTVIQKRLTSMRGFFRAKPIELRIAYPQTFEGSLKLKCRNGDISVGSGVFSDMDIYAQNGEFSIFKVNSGKIKLNAGNGSVALKEVMSPNVSVKLSNGGIKLDSINAESLDIDGFNAMIMLSGISACTHLYVKTKNGKIDMKQISSPDISAATNNGKISGVILGDKDDYKMNLQTDNGFIAIDNNEVIKSFNSLATGQSKKLTAHTVNGAIDIKFSQG